MRYALGIDVGGSKIAAGVVGDDGCVLATSRLETPVHDLDAFVETVRECGLAALSDAADPRLAAVGVGLPAQIESDGTIPHCTNLGFLMGSDVSVRLSAAFDADVAVENDANLAAFGEARCGFEPTDSLVLVTLGTGAGGGVVADGRMLRGPHGSGGELGHMVLMADGPLCPCGQRGCLEALVAGSFVAERARRGMHQPGGGDSTLWSVAGAPASIEAEHVVSAARDGDRVARAVVDETGRYLGAAFCSLANIFAPRRIALGGGLGEAAADLLLPVATEVVTRDALAGSRRGLVIAPASLGQAAGIVGAAIFALDSAAQRR